MKEFMDYIAIIHQFIDGILNFPEKVVIEQLEGDSEKDLVYLIYCSKEDTGRLIGKHGSTADALREVLSVVAKDHNQRVHIKLATLSED